MSCKMVIFHWISGTVNKLSFKLGRGDKQPCYHPLLLQIILGKYLSVMTIVIASINMKNFWTTYLINSPFTNNCIYNEELLDSTTILPPQDPGDRLLSSNSRLPYSQLPIPHFVPVVSEYFLPFNPTCVPFDFSLSPTVRLLLSFVWSGPNVQWAGPNRGAKINKQQIELGSKCHSIQSKSHVLRLSIFDIIMWQGQLYIIILQMPKHTLFPSSQCILRPMDWLLTPKPELPSGQVSLPDYPLSKFLSSTVYFLIYLSTGLQALKFHHLCVLGT